MVNNFIQSQIPAMKEYLKAAASMYCMFWLVLVKMDSSHETLITGTGIHS